MADVVGKGLIWAISGWWKICAPEVEVLNKAHKESLCGYFVLDKQAGFLYVRSVKKTYFITVMPSCLTNMRESLALDCMALGMVSFKSPIILEFYLICWIFQHPEHSTPQNNHFDINYSDIIDTIEY